MFLTDELLKQIKAKVSLTEEQENQIFNVIHDHAVQLIARENKLKDDATKLKLELSKQEDAVANMEGIVEEFFEAAGGRQIFGMFEPGRDPYKLAVEAVRRTMHSDVSMPALQAFGAFKDERHYQDLKYGTLKEKDQSFAGFMLCMRHAVEKAIVAWIKEDETTALKEVVQVGAVATVILEKCGVPPGRTPMEMDKVQRRAALRRGQKPGCGIID